MLVALTILLVALKPPSLAGIVVEIILEKAERRIFVWQSITGRC